MKPRLLVINPSLQPPGGGNGVAVWGLQALAQDYRITLELWEPLRLDAINRYYGTSLTAGDFEEIRVAPAILRMLWRIAPFPLASMQRAVQSRRARRIAQQFDAVMTFNNEVDVGRLAIQYTHFPWRYWPRPEADIRWYHRIPGVLPLYFHSTARMAGFSRARAAQNLTLVNSDWTGSKYREEYGADCTTLYPPVFPSRSQKPWAEREDTFLAIGRIAPEKNLETAIAILDRVRARGHDVRFVIAGSRGERAYVRRIEALVAERPWASIASDLSREELERLIGSSRYGLHAMLDEHFGIAVAEVSMSGGIPFVHRSGGPMEIVGDARLLYDSVDDAAVKITQVLASAALQDELRARLVARSERFTFESFARQLRAITSVTILSR